MSICLFLIFGFSDLSLNKYFHDCAWIEISSKWIHLSTSKLPLLTFVLYFTWILSQPRKININVNLEIWFVTHRLLYAYFSLFLSFFSSIKNYSLISSAIFFFSFCHTLQREMTSKSLSQVFRFWCSVHMKVFHSMYICIFVFLLFLLYCTCLLLCLSIMSFDDCNFVLISVRNSKRKRTTQKRIAIISSIFFLLFVVFKVKEIFVGQINW